MADSLIDTLRNENKKLGQDNVKLRQLIVSIREVLKDKGKKSAISYIEKSIMEDRK